MIRRTLLPAAFILFSVLAWAPPALARSLAVDEFHARIQVDPDGAVRVEERIRVTFDGSWNGIFRWIPYGYTYPNGLRGMIQLRLEAVEDDAGRELEHWTKRSAGRLEVKVRVPGAVNATRTVVFRYRAYDVVRLQKGKDESYGAYDELYWNVTGNDWVAPIARAVADIELPADVPENRIRATGFVGTYGARDEDYRIEKTGPTSLRVTTTRTLHPGAGLTVAVTFPPGHVAKPGAVRRIGWWVMANWHALLPLAVLFLWWLAWRAWGRDPLGGRTIVPDWRAPDGLRPSEVGVLADDTLDRRDVTATIVDLAVRGVLRIHERQKDWELELVPEGRRDANLSPFEKKLLDALFEDGKTSVEFGDLKYKFHKEFDGIRSSVLDGLVAKKLFAARPDKIVGRWLAFTFLALIALVVIGLQADTTWLYWVTLVPSVLLMFVIANAMPRRTAKGLDALARIKGLEEYIETAERDRMEREDAGLFDRVLPLAIALGLSDRWARAFEGLYEREPDWYRARRGGALDSWAVVHGVDDMNRDVGRTLMAVPRSNGSSGTGGHSWGGGWSGGGGFSGGSSGGGFGGGGGGGW